MNPNWAEQVTAIATAIGCIGLTSTLVLAVLAGRQVREAQRGRHAQLAADFIRRWDEPALVEARRLVAEQADGQQLAATFSASVADNSMAAYVLMPLGLSYEISAAMGFYWSGKCRDQIEEINSR